MENIGIFNDLVQRIDTNIYKLTEDQSTNQKFIMDLNIVIPEGAKLYRLVEKTCKKGITKEVEDSKMKFLKTKKFPDGVFIKVMEDNQYEILIFELKRTATNQLKTIPEQLHSGLLHAMSIIRLNEMQVSTDNSISETVPVKITYKLFVGFTSNVVSNLETLKVIPGNAAIGSSREMKYNNNVVYYEFNGLEIMELPIEKIIFQEINNNREFNSYSAEYNI